MLEFIDGVSFDLNGDYRIETRDDGLYVVGQGMLCAVETREEGEQLITDLQSSSQES